MKRYIFRGYVLTMKETTERDSYNHIMVKYSLKTKGITLFSGSDFGASPMHSPEGRESACALLDFLCIRPGDIDKGYFADYTKAQLKFAENEAEGLGYNWRAHLGDPDCQ